MRPHPAYPAEALNALTTLVLGIPGLDEADRPVSRSQVEWAVALKPTTVILWIGNNDALESVLVGDSSFLTPRNDFKQAFAQIMAKLAPTGASVLVGNIPDATSLPFVLPPHVAVSIASGGQVAGGQMPLVLQQLGIATPGTMVPATAIGVIAAMLAGNGLAPLDDSLVLTPAELEEIQTRIGEFNSVIATMARRNGVALVDINKLMKEIAASVPPEQFAGLFSPDLVHPNSLGHLLLANEFIRALNQNFGNQVPEVPLP
jgi:lysophospholipase L1-like esterase